MCNIRIRQVALEHGIRSIAFPSISTGVYSFPVELAAKIAVKTVSRFLEDNENMDDIENFYLTSTSFSNIMSLNSMNKRVLYAGTSQRAA